MSILPASGMSDGSRSCASHGCVNSCWLYGHSICACKLCIRRGSARRSWRKCIDGSPRLAVGHLYRSKMRQQECRALFCRDPEKDNDQESQLALIATVALVGLASPALPQPFDENEAIGNLLPFNSHRVAPENVSLHAVVHSARRHGLNSFAMEPRARSDSNSHPYNASRAPAFDPRGTSAYPFGPGINFPYPDRPYGIPIIGKALAKLS